MNHRSQWHADLLCCLGFACTPVSAVEAQNVTIQGRSFYLDGKQWILQGSESAGLAKSSHQRAKDNGAMQAKAYWGDSEIRALKDVLKVDTLRLQASPAGLDPRSSDYDSTYHENAKQWHDQFGARAERYPLIATEWNATQSNGCVGPDTPQVALSLVRYLEGLHVGLNGWAIESNYGKLFKDHTNFEPTNYSTFTDCSKAPGDSGAGKLLANYPND
jgi:hypothetical protein